MENSPLRAKSSPIRSVAALLVSLALLITGHGLQQLLVPIRGELEGFSAIEIGLLGSGYFFGFVLGCLATPRLILGVGHSKAFIALTAIAAAVALSYPVVLHPFAWIGLRMVTGCCLAGLYLVVESWLNDAATNETRGMLISTYVSINFVMITLGQMIATLISPSSFVLFSIVSMFMLLAAVPLTITQPRQPASIAPARFRPLRLFRLSPTGTISILLSGLATGAFWSLVPSYVTVVSGNVPLAATFMSVAVLGGALLQWPAGKISDVVDRRIVMVALCVLCALAGLWLMVVPRLDGAWLVVAFAYGAGLLPTYAVAAAHVYDFAERSEYVEVSAGLLLLYGAGSTLGPLLASVGIELFGLQALFVSNALIQVLSIGCVVLTGFFHRKSSRLVAAD